MYKVKNKLNEPAKFFDRIASKWVTVPAGGTVQVNFKFMSNHKFEVTEIKPKKKEDKE